MMLELNRIIKVFDQKPYFLFAQNGSQLLEANKSLQVTSEAVGNVLRHETMYDELILLKASLDDFASIDEFVTAGVLKAEFMRSEIRNKIVGRKKEISEDEFNTILGWGFLDMFEEIENPLRFKYSSFSIAHTYFKIPSKPIFAAILDDSYFLFINNTNTEWDPIAE